MTPLTRNERDLAEKPIGRLLWSYSVPAMVGMLSSGLYNMVDTIFVGRAVGPLGLAGLQVALPVQILVLASALTIAVGSASIVSRALGAGQHGRAVRVAGASIVQVVVLCLVLTALLNGFIGPVVRFCGATPDIAPYARDYLRVVVLGNAFLGIAVVGNQLLRAEGNAVPSMVAMFIGAGSNILLDPIFLFALDMGVQGAALATVLAQMLASVYLFWFLSTDRTALRMGGDDLHLDLAGVPEVVGIGASSMVRLGGDTALMVVVNRVVRRYGGDASSTYIAIVGLFVRVVRFVSMPLIGVLQGLRPIVGFNYGAGRFNRVRRAIKVAAVVETAVSAAAFVVIMAAPRTVLAAFTKDEDVLRLGAPVMRTAIMLMPLLGVQMLGPGVFQALDRAWSAMILSLARRLLFVVPMVLILPRYLGLPGVWYAFPLSEALTSVLTIGCLWHFNHRLRDWHENGAPESLEVGGN